MSLAALDPQFVAAGDADNIAKLIFFVIAAVIWGIGAIAKIAGQKSEQEKRRRVAQGIQNATAGYQQKPRPQLAESIRQRLPPYSPAPVRTVKPRPAAKQSRSSRVQPPPPLPAQTSPAPTVSSMVDSLITTARFEIPAAKSRAAGAALPGLLNPATLRQQFILTELLQPPLALRESRA
jgi:hypothetical protein